MNRKVLLVGTLIVVPLFYTLLDDVGASLSLLLRGKERPGAEAASDRAGGSSSGDVEALQPEA